MKTKVKLTQPHIVNGFEHSPGTVLEMSAESAEWLIGLKRAEPIDAPPAPAAATTSKPSR